MKAYTINKWRLMFDNPKIEAEYQVEETSKNVRQQRFALILSIPFYLAFAPVDYFQAKALLPLFWFIRFGIYLPLALLTYVATFHENYTRHAQKIVSLLIIIGGVGMMVMTLAGSEIEFYSYKYGFLFTLLFATSLVKLRFVNVIKVTIPLVLVYIMVSMSYDFVPTDVNVDSIIVYVVAVGLGSISSYFLESSERKQFVLRKMMEQEKEKVAHTNMVLEEKVKERTEHLNAVILSLTEANQKLKTSEITFRKLFEDSSDAVLLVKNGVILNCNQEFVSLLKYFHKSDLVGKETRILTQDSESLEAKHKNNGFLAIDIMMKTGETVAFHLKTTNIVLDGDDVVYCVVKAISS